MCNMKEKKRKTRAVRTYRPKHAVAELKYNSIINFYKEKQNLFTIHQTCTKLLNFQRPNLTKYGVELRGFNGFSSIKNCLFLNN